MSLHTFSFWGVTDLYPKIFHREIYSSIQKLDLLLILKNYGFLKYTSDILHHHVISLETTSSRNITNFLNSKLGTYSIFVTYPYFGIHLAVT